ncbi:MAG: aldo/keto reductase, partial [Candidatus Eiseniibacteriota bacterium]
EPALSVNLELVEALRSLAARAGRTPAQLAVAWVLRRPEVTAAIVGARHPEQIEETVVAGDWELPAELVKEIGQLLASRQQVLASEPGA